VKHQLCLTVGIIFSRPLGRGDIIFPTRGLLFDVLCMLDNLTIKALTRVSKETIRFAIVTAVEEKL